MKGNKSVGDEDITTDENIPIPRTPFSPMMIPSACISPESMYGASFTISFAGRCPTCVPRTLSTLIALGSYLQKSQRAPLLKEGRLSDNVRVSGLSSQNDDFVGSDEAIVEPTADDLVVQAAIQLESRTIVGLGEAYKVGLVVVQGVLLLLRECMARARRRHSLAGRGSGPWTLGPGSCDGIVCEVNNLTSTFSRRHCERGRGCRPGDRAEKRTRARQEREVDAFIQNVKRTRTRISYQAWNNLETQGLYGTRHQWPLSLGHQSLSEYLQFPA